MFAIEQIKAAHSKVKSGADFPAYIKDLKQLSVISYETFVKDGHTIYSGENNYTIASQSRYDEVNIAEESNPDQFKTDLKAHQMGKTDYMTFCKDCAKSGVEKWKVSVTEMTCTYFDRAGREVLVEKISG